MLKLRWWAKDVVYLFLLTIIRLLTIRYHVLYRTPHLSPTTKASGDLVGKTLVVDKIKGDFSELFLGGQNHYAVFAELATDVNGKLTQGTDQAIEALFLEATNAYVNGEQKGR